MGTHASWVGERKGDNPALPGRITSDPPASGRVSFKKRKLKTLASG